MEEYDVRLTNHAEALLGRVNELRKLDCFADVLLYCEDRIVRAHKVILASSSAYWDAVFRRLPPDVTATRFPLVVMPETPVAVLELVLEFIYLGQVSVPCERMQEFMDLADMLQIRGFHDAKRPHFTLPTPGQTAVTPDPAAVAATISAPAGPSPSSAASPSDLNTMNNNNNNNKNTSSSSSSTTTTTSNRNTSHQIKRVKKEALQPAAAESATPVPKKRPATKRAPVKKERAPKKSTGGVRRSLRDRQQRGALHDGVSDREPEELPSNASQPDQDGTQAKAEQVAEANPPKPSSVAAGGGGGGEVSVSSRNGPASASVPASIPIPIPTPTPTPAPTSVTVRTFASTSAPGLCASDLEIAIPSIVSEHDEIIRVSDFMWKGVGKNSRAAVYFCAMCGFTSQWSKVARDHQRIHTGERPFLCPVCARKFSVRSNLRRHLRNIHKQKVPEIP